MMPDREKTIKEYEDYVNSYIPVTTCGDYILEMHKAVLALLKGQEAKLVRIDEDSVHCPSCGNELFTYPRQKFCDECGQAVKWDA